MSTQLLAPQEHAATETRSMRVDPPHVRPVEAADSPPHDPQADAPVEALFEPSDVWAQMRTQARQLADLLRDRQQELDRREANLQAQAAGWEQEARSGRLWLRDQLQELAEREAALVECSPQTAGDERAAPKQRGEALADEHELLAARREELEARVAQHERRAAAERAELKELRRRTHEELEEKRSLVEREAKNVETRRCELERIKNELREAQRETLEMHLATEELWGQLAAAVPPAALARSLGRLRQRLTDQFRLASSELEGQKNELALLRARLRDHCDGLVRRRAELQQWFERRQAELQEQAELQAVREEDLQRQQAELERRYDRWHEERQGKRREIQDAQQTAGDTLPSP